MAFPVGLFASVLVVLFSFHALALDPAGAGDATKAAAGAAGAAAAAAADQPKGADAATTAEDKEDKDKETDKAHLLQIWKAIMAYKKDHGTIPDYLSDLVPQYVPDKEVFVSPVQKDHRQGAMDPKFRTSHSYEFGAQEFAGGGRTFRDVKQEQMKEFGPVVPILRCFAHKEVMNVAYAGDYYESGLYWESSPAARELMAKLGPGAGFDDGDFADLRVVEDESGAAIAGAEVRLTRRFYHALPLPDKTLKTDADGKVRVPLGPAQPPSRQLTVTVVKAGFFALPETWREGSLPAEKTFRMSPAATIGGLVKDHDGAPVAGARVGVYVTLGAGDAAAGVAAAANFGGVPQEVATRPRLVDTVATDAAGRWHCDTVPKEFAVLTLRVDHEAAWRTEFRCAKEGDAANAGGAPVENKPDGAEKAAAAAPVEREALLGQTAEFKLEPAAVLTGVLQGPDGTPLPGEEVTVAQAGQQVGETFAVATRGASARTPARKVKTDAAGRFTLTLRQAEDLVVSASPKNLALVMRSVTAAPGLEPLQLKASARRRIAGQVRDEDGKPVKGVRVTFIGWAEVSVEKKVAETNDRGEFAWDAAPNEQIGLTFNADGFAQSTEWLEAGRKEPVAVNLRKEQ